MNRLNCEKFFRTSGGEIMIDVRTRKELGEGESANAKNVPLADLPLYVQHFDKSDAVLIYGCSFNRGLIAEKILLSMGFSNITNIGSIYRYQYCH